MVRDGNFSGHNPPVVAGVFSCRVKYVMAGLVILTCLLVNFPWSYIVSTVTVLPEYAGWALPGVLLLVMAFSRSRAFACPPLLLLSFFLLSLPLLWMAPDTDVWRAVTRVLMLWCGGIFFLWLAARQTTEAEAAYAGTLLVSAGLVFALSVILFVLWPDGYAHWMPLPEDMRASGGFRQVNVMASFLATLVALGLHRWLYSGRRVFLLCLVVLMVALTWTQSTVGRLGVVVAAGLMVVAGWQTVRSRLWPALLVLAVSWAAARLTMTLMALAPLVDHGGQAMRLQIWQATLALLASHPLSGVGYGMFEGSYPQGLARLHEVSLDTINVVGHPHNELLYWAAEGGAVALAGLGCLLAYGLWMAASLWRQARAAGGYGKPGCDAVGIGVCALPVLLHSQTEYPWYQSPLHYVLFLFLAGLAVSRLNTSLSRPSSPVLHLCGAYVQGAVGALLTLAGAGLLYFTLSGTAVRMSIDASKQGMASDVRSFERVRRLNPWFQPDQQAFVTSLHDMQLFNQDHDVVRLGRAERFYRDYLRRHPDPNVYDMYLQVLLLQGKTAQAGQVYREAHWRCGWDSRFSGNEE